MIKKFSPKSLRRVRLPPATTKEAAVMLKDKLFQRALDVYRSARITAELACMVGALGFEKGGDVHKAHRVCFAAAARELKKCGVRDVDLFFDCCVEAERRTGNAL